jgi:C4-dicarboxylate-specific signal transduction histidine kinase
MADRGALGQVIQNLVKNAIEATSAGTERRRELTITTRRCARNRVLVAVRDVGSGFPRGHEEKLFAPFYSTKAHGMGIGLSVSRSIVEHQGGRLRGRPNADGRGATFWMSLPAASATPMYEKRPRCGTARAADALAYA